ncbi:alpha/beta fold hydrolase [Psychromonas antarctica]|uniref:alpha/beta fold hydrolase n=1 Tax=Psychromonas antarctica TaxID=67573 RepID=UPI001EE8C3BE|nr:alpha/beta fold hydrolase [Psychromonas antarctica]MCG6201505.1 alpha/beta hydrolase [Psychromonas antarctica]
MFRSILAIIFTALLFSCGGGGNSTKESSILVPTQASDSCPASMQCDFFTAPKDYNDNESETVKIHYGIHHASDTQNRIGILVFNFGGPGGEAVNGTAWMVENNLPQSILAHFDVIGMDPRGSGKSAFAQELSDCAIAARNHRGNCDSVLADVAPYLGSNSVVKDLDQLRITLGEQKLNFMGYSYGTRLGALYANMYPEKVRAIVLDSPMSPDEVNYFESVKGKISGFDLVVDYRLGFDASKKSKYIHVFDAINRTGSYTAADSVSLNSSEASNALFATAGRETSANWSKIKTGVSDLLDNNHAQRLKIQIPNIYYPAVSEDDLRSAVLFDAVSCTDEIMPLSYNDIVAKHSEYDAISTLFAPVGKNWSTRCADWPFAQDPIAVVETMENVLTDQQILIIVGKYDTNTPYIWGAKMAASFAQLASVITVDNLADHGFSYTGLSCVDKNTTQYLLHPTNKIADETCSGALLNKKGALSITNKDHPAKRMNPRWY